MARISSRLRKTIFENAINKLFGERLEAEREAFEDNVEAVVLKMLQRIAKKNGVDYKALTTIYKPYTKKNSYFNFKSDSGFFTEELTHIFFNENIGVLEYEGAHFDLVSEYKDQRAYHAQVYEPQPSCGDESFSEAERKEINAVFKKYADFMKEVISAACLIRDVINSASTTKQLCETSPELGEFIPEEIGVTALVPTESIKKVSALFRNK